MQFQLEIIQKLAKFEDTFYKYIDLVECKIKKNSELIIAAPLTTEKLNKGRMGRTERLGSNLSVITEESYCATGSTGHSTTSSDEEALSEPTKEEPSVR